MQALNPYLISALNNFEAYSLLIVVVGVVGDISRSIEHNIVPYCPDIFTALIRVLQNPELHRSVKPHVLCVFGDIALAIGVAYEPYLQISLMMLLQASQMSAPSGEEELIEYINELREAVMEAYTGIIQGLNDGHLLDKLAPFIDAVINFLEMVAADDNRTESLLERTIGLLG
jgi:importin subunit beta-1